MNQQAYLSELKRRTAALITSPDVLMGSITPAQLSAAQTTVELSQLLDDTARRIAIDSMGVME